MCKSDNSKNNLFFMQIVRLRLMAAKFPKILFPLNFLPFFEVLLHTPPSFPSLQLFQYGLAGVDILQIKSKNAPGCKNFIEFTPTQVIPVPIDVAVFFIRG